MLNAAGFACAQCNNKDETLHVHHKQYIKGRSAWEYDDEELVVLCESCHQREHEQADFINKLLACVPTEYKHDLVGILTGITYVTTGDNRIIDESSHNGVDQIMLMAGIASFKCRELDLTGMDRLSKFLKEEIEQSKARRKEWAQRNAIRGLN